MTKKSDMNQSTETTKSVADGVWEDIKDSKLELFALPDQFVNMYCEPIAIEPSKLYLKFKVSAVLPALEVALAGRYVVERVDKYICVSPAEKK